MHRMLLYSPKDGRAPWTCSLTPLHRGDPLTKMHEEMQKMGANLPPGAALAVQIPDEARKPSSSRSVTEDAAHPGLVLAASGYPQMPHFCEEQVSFASLF